MKVFDARAVRRRLPMAVCIDLMARVQTALSRGEIRLPLRSAVPVPGHDGAARNSLLVMPGALPDPQVFGAKLLSLFPGNPDLDPARPALQGFVLLFHGGTGEPMALVDAASLTAIRTAAASAAATRVLARPQASTLALLGYGVQAASHLEAMRAVQPIRGVRVWGPDPDRARAFAARHGNGLAIQAAASAESAVREADVVCAVSAATAPILRRAWLAPGCHVNLVGAHTPDAREADGATLRDARVFTEISEFALAEAGDLLLAMEEGLITPEDIAGEIGAVFGGELAGREHPQQITVYKSLGNTAQDLMAAHHVVFAGETPG